LFIAGTEESSWVLYISLIACEGYNCLVSGVFVDSFQIFYMDDHYHVICKDNFIYSFSICINFIPFCLLAFTRISNLMLKSSGERRHPCIVPHHSEKDLSFLPLSMMSAAGHYRCSLLNWGSSPSIPTLLRAFNYNGYWMLSNVF
jgi:hypothetical protein